MPTRAAEQQNGAGVGTAAKQVAEHASALARLELELAQLELKEKAGALAGGAVLGVGAALVALFAVGFLLAAAAAGLATAIPTWAALLVVGGVLVLGAVLLGLLAAQLVRRGSPPVPEQAIREAKLTSEALRS